MNEITSSTSIKICIMSSNSIIMSVQINSLTISKTIVRIRKSTITILVLLV